MPAPLPIGEWIRRERLVMRAIRKGARRGLPPGLSHIAADTGLTMPQVCRTIGRLRAQGRVTPPVKVGVRHTVRPAGMAPPAPIVPQGLAGWRRDLVAYYAAFQLEHGRPPALSQARNPLKCTTLTAYGHMHTLLREGVLIAAPANGNDSRYMLPAKEREHPIERNEDMKRNLTRGQRATLDAIRDLIAELGHPPTVLELAGRLGANVSNTWRYLFILERKGYIERTRHTLSGQANARSLRLTGLEEQDRDQDREQA